MNPKGKTALITGGTVRVGKAITLALAQAGVIIIVLGRRPPRRERRGY
jgi:NAD(P)-dependent dehydrogenase (short-subunit alcohol dehydrogenase family)